MSGRTLIGLAVVAAAAAGVWWIAHTEQPEAERQPDPVSLRVTEATIVLRHKGARQAEITAERVEVSADRQVTTFAGQTRAVLFEDEAPFLTMTGGRIVYDRAREAVQVVDGLSITTARGEMLLARSGTWDQVSQVVELTGDVVAAPAQGSQRVAGGKGRLRADRIRYEIRTRTIVASGNVRLEIDDVEIGADTLRIEQDPQVAVAEGGVRVSRRDARLEAPVVRYEFQTETAEASGGVTFEQEGAVVRAPRMGFDLRAETTIATGGVEVRHGQSTLTAPSLRYEARTGDVAAEGGVTLVQPGSRLTGHRLLANLRARRADVRGNVVLVRAPGPPPSPADRTAAALAREETTITAGRMVFRWDADEAEAEDDVVVTQRDKRARADRMTYSEPSNRLVMIGRVELEQASGEWLVREGLASPPRDARAQEALASMTRLTCTRLTMTLRERDITAEGPLTVTQKDRVATGDRGQYTEATRLLVITGNARLQDADGQRLRADRVVISLTEETFEAEGNVETEFVIRTGPSPTPRP